MELISRVFLLGLFIVAGVLLFTPYEAFLEAGIAVAIVAAVVVGFLMHPRNEVFYVRTAVRLVNRDRQRSVEHDFVAVRVQIVRLWLLFLPTSTCVAFLVFFAAPGSRKFSVLNWALSSWWALLGLMLMEFSSVFVLVSLSVWIRERRVIRNAEACSARSFSISGKLVSYQFMGEHGEYYGGYCMYFGLVRPRELANVVFYDEQKPDLNRIAMGFLFHGLTVLGRGVTELDEETTATQKALAQTASWS